MSDTDADTRAPSPTFSPEVVGFATAVLRIALMALFTNLVTRGWATEENAATLADFAVPVILPAIGFIAVAAWSLYNRTKSRMIKLVANMRGVSTVHVTPELAAKVVDSSVVPTPPASP